MARRGLRRLAWIGAGVAGGMVLLVLVFQGLTADLQPDEDDSNATYSPGLVELGDLNETVVASGTMEPLVRVSVISEVSGMIDQVHVEAGDRVTRGQPLFELDRERLQSIFLVHGDLERQEILGSAMNDVGYEDVQIPERGETVVL